MADRSNVGQGLQDHMNVRHAHFKVNEKLPMPVGMGAEAQMLAALDPDDAQRNVQLLFAQVPLGEAPFGFLEGVTTLVGVMKPHSRGSIALTSADPMAAPAIDPGYLSDARDVAALKAGLDLAQALQAESGLAKMGSAVSIETDDLDALIRSTAGGYYHLTGGCGMGTSDDAVCAPDLSVNGVTGLRVADASVAPTIPSVNTMATAFMIGERASELIVG